MTREHSLRHSYWKTHKLPTLPKAEFLNKKEEPETKKKREVIYARIRAAELSSERYNREKQGKKLLEAEGNDSSEGDYSPVDSIIGIREMRSSNPDEIMFRPRYYGPHDEK
jgi:hypothetical protein